MKRIFLIILIAMMPASGFAETGVVVNIMPGYILYSPDASGFQVTDGRKIEEVEGYVSNTAMLTTGIGMDLSALYFDMTAGGGFFWSSSMTATVMATDIAFRFKLNREMTLGPHIMILMTNPTWKGDTEIKLAKETGFAGGLSFTIGNKPFFLAASLDYLSLSFGLDSGTAIEDDSLDLSGIALQLGVVLRF